MLGNPPTRKHYAPRLHPEMVTDGSEKFARSPSSHVSYQARYFALPSPYLGRFMFGFRLKAKPEHEAAQVGRW